MEAIYLISSFSRQPTSPRSSWLEKLLRSRYEAKISPDDIYSFAEGASTRLLQMISDVESNKSPKPEQHFVRLQHILSTLMRDYY